MYNSTFGVNVEASHQGGQHQKATPHLPHPHNNCPVHFSKKKESCVFLIPLALSRNSPDDTMGILCSPVSLFTRIAAWVSQIRIPLSVC